MVAKARAGLKTRVVRGALACTMSAVLAAALLPAVALQAPQQAQAAVVQASGTFGESTKETSAFYTFTLPTSGRIQLSSTWTLQGSFSIYDSKMNRVWYDNSWDSWNDTAREKKTSYLVDLTSGTYQLELNPNGNTGRYSASINFLSAEESFAENGGVNNSMSTAQSIDTNTMYRGQLAENDREDFYKFYLNEASAVRIITLSNMKHYWKLYDQNGERITYSYYDNDYNDVSGEKSTSKVVYLTAGTYYLSFEDGQTGNFSFKVSAASAGESFAEAQGGSNDSTQTAQSISVGATYRGNLADNERSDYYKFTASGTVTVLAVADQKMKFEIYDSGPRSEWYSSSYSDWNDTSARKTVTDELTLDPGTYYLAVSDGSGNYTFRIASGSVSTNSLSVNTYPAAEALNLINPPYISTPIDLTISLKGGKISGPKAKYAYNGKSKTPRVTVTLQGRTLTQGTDYTVRYTNNKKVGKARVTVTGTGNYSGSIGKSFKIVPKATKLTKVKGGNDKFTPKWKKVSGVTGYQLRYTSYSSTMSYATKVTVKGSKKTSKRIRYSTWYGTRIYVQVRAYKKVNGTKYYSAWSKKKSAYVR